MGRTSGAASPAVSSYIGSGVNLTMGTPANVTSVSLTVGSWLIFGTVSSQSPAGSNCVECWLGPTTASATSAYVGGNGAYIDSSRASTTTLVAYVTLTVTTTVYLVACALDANATVSPTSYSVGLVPNASGILAIP
jgi:hypothetical protein